MAERGKDMGADRIRASMSVEGRQVVALERISDQLAVIADAMREKATATPPPDTARKSASIEKAGSHAWENEGGSLAASPRDLPAGITRTRFDRFQVGRYLYTDLGSAVAELRRQQGSL